MPTNRAGAARSSAIARQCVDWLPGRTTANPDGFAPNSSFIHTCENNWHENCSHKKVNVLDIARKRSKHGYRQF